MTSTRRGFSLVIVVVLGVAAFVVASTLIAVSESARTRVAHSVQGDHAAAIAQAGMERTRAYLQAATASALDFDLVLDPDLEANCAGLPAAPPTVPASSQVLRPKLSDGTRVTYRGKDWTRVPYDGGAYLVRFEDDADDFRTQGTWADSTNNTVIAATTNCREGPVSLGTADNPFRDRNQAISVTVIGIAPGLDPDRAVHRSTLRRLETFPGLAVVAGIQVRGNVNVAGSARLQACSPIASMQIDGNLSGDGSGTGCACGESRADSVSSEWSHCSLSTACTSPPIGCLAGTMGTPGPSVPAVLALDSGPGVDFYFDWAAPDTAPPVRDGSCIFRIDGPTNVWWWDPMADRGDGGARCSTFESSPFISSLPPIDPSATTGFGACWTPILRGADALVTSELVGGEWRPNNTETLVNSGTLVGLFPPGTTLRKPNWQDCKVIGHPAGSPLFCATCTGSSSAMDGSPLWFSGDTAAQLTAIPAGTYIFDIAVSPQAMNAPVGTAPGQLNTSTFIPSQWPLMTVATTGSITVNSRIVLGLSGNGAAAFPAIITNGDIDIQANNENLIGGSVWSRGNWNWRGGSDNFFFGELHLDGNWEMAGNSSFFWNYQNQLSGAQIFPTPTAPAQTWSLD